MTITDHIILWLNKTENITLVCTFISYQTAVVSPTWVISEKLLSKDMLAELSGLERVVLLLFIILAIIGYFVFTEREFFDLSIYKYPI